MQKHIVFLESNLTGSGYEAMAAARAAGHHVTFLTRDVNLYTAPGHEKLDPAWLDNVVTCDTNDPDSVVATVKNLDRPADALLAVGEWHMICAAEAGRALGLPGPSPDGVRAARDKSRTRQLCAEAGVPVPRFVRVTTPQEAHRTGLPHPCVVKPLDDAGSNGVRLCATHEESAAHVRTILADTHNERGQRKIPAALVEEYIDGPEVSVEILVYDGTPTVVALTWKELSSPPYFFETGHHVPADLDPESAERCARVATDSLRAVGFDMGVAHVELRLATDGPRLIEINCRPAGDRITYLVALATGVNLCEELVRMHVEPWTPPAITTRSAAAIAFLPAGPGEVRAVRGADRARLVEGVTDVSLYVNAGDHSRPQLNNTARHAHAIAVGPTGRQAHARAREALAELRVETSLEPHSGKAVRP
ncbi:ATP-grasp domain-containing protein [Streptomyces sp. NPDC048219]|uniref:ATP-grasp domain-containing protein n=1 Tax=Streptomyces sp. NPDC048219 TaxID=3365517 RepID=UPI00372014B9